MGSYTGSCSFKNTADISTKQTPKTATFHSKISDKKENNSTKLVTFDLILLMEKKHRFCPFFFKYNYQKCSLRASPQDFYGNNKKNLFLVQMTSLGRQKLQFFFHTFVLFVNDKNELFFFKYKTYTSFEPHLLYKQEMLP